MTATENLMGKGIAVVTLVVSIVAAIIIFAIFPPKPINILLGVILGLLIYIAIYTEENYHEF